jgi:hypothetical protein
LLSKVNVKIGLSVTDLEKFNWIKNDLLLLSFRWEFCKIL